MHFKNSEMYDYVFEILKSTIGTCMSRVRISTINLEYHRLVIDSRLSQFTKVSTLFDHFV